MADPQTLDTRPDSAIHVIAPDDDVAVAVRALAAGERVSVGGQAVRALAAGEQVSAGGQAVRVLAAGERVRVGGRTGETAEAGETAETAETAARRTIEVREAIPQGHKLALRRIAANEVVRKYGWPIGRAVRDIEAGELVHTENLVTRLSGLEGYEYQPRAESAGGAANARAGGTASARAGAADARAGGTASAEAGAADARAGGTAGAGAGGTAGAGAVGAGATPTFMGYRRADGRVGTRNEIWIVTTVGCVTRTAARLAQVATERFAGRVQGIHAFTHPFGCSQLGDDLARTRRVLASLVSHPNAGGVLVIGLGCESNQLEPLLQEVGAADRSRIRHLSAQACEDEEEEGLRAIAELVEIVERDVRVPCPLSALSVGLKCGGSDGLSGITANPLVGAVADCVTRAGGTAILTEIPEVFGAEHLLMQRADNRQVFESIVALVNGFKTYFLAHGQPIYENPSPGNRAGGITTLEEKSLGAVQKGGHTPVTQVLQYGARAHLPGLALLESPGNDAISSTALVAAGATVLLFTTGRGTPLGFPVPTVKISSNTALAARKPRWIDFDAGRVLTGLEPRIAAQKLLELVVATASGQPARNELNGEREIALWKSGVTL